MASAGTDQLINIAGALGGDFDDKFFGGDADDSSSPVAATTPSTAAPASTTSTIQLDRWRRRQPAGAGHSARHQREQGSDTFTNIEGSTAAPSTTR